MEPPAVSIVQAVQTVETSNDVTRFASDIAGQ
jgi:hypothetical protein